MVRKCVETQQIPGYEHRLITLENCYKGSSYVNECLAAKRWVKASDWLRVHNLFSEGGIYLDGDMSIMPGKNFDHLLHHKLFLSKEISGWLWANAAMGSEAGHPVLQKYLSRVENNYRGSGDDVFAPGIRTYTDVFWDAFNHGLAELYGIHECPVEYFFPYDHLQKKMNITDDTIVFHHYMTSWQGVLLDKEPKKEFKFFCDYHLGDQLFVLWLLNEAARLWPHIKLSFCVEPTYFNEVKALARKLPNLEVTDKMDGHVQLEWWHGDWATHKRNPDRPHFVSSMLKLQKLIAAAYGLPELPAIEKTNLLLPAECMDSTHTFNRDFEFDVLFVNSAPLSGQCVGYDANRMNVIAVDLIGRGLKVVTTHPCGYENVSVTTELNMTLAQIGELASRCRVVAGVANAPFIATFNELAVQKIERWINYGCDVLDFDDRVVGANSLDEFADLCSQIERRTP